MAAGSCETEDTSGGRASRTSSGETSRGAGHGGPHVARFSARIGPNTTSEAELFRSPCQRISLHNVRSFLRLAIRPGGALVRGWSAVSREELWDLLLLAITGADRITILSNEQG